MASIDDVLTFWRAAGPDRWFKKDEAFDRDVTTRFAEVYREATGDKLAAWEASPDGALALILVLDQFPRNMFRGQAAAFAADPMARAVAVRALARGFDQALPAADRLWFYLPFEHSEALSDQERACALLAAHGDADLLKWAKVHADIIRRFGRFPHRNAVLGRVSTAEEQAFLDAGGFAG